MKLIKLTVDNGYEIYYSVDKIIFFYRTIRQDATAIVTVEDVEPGYVKETPKEIMRLVEGRNANEYENL